MTDINTPTGNPEFDIQDQDELHEIHQFDFERCAMLMTIAEKVATVAPKNTSLLGIAQAELESLNKQAMDIARRRADRAKAAEQRRYEAEQAKLREEANAAEAGEPAPRTGTVEPAPRAIPSAALPADPQPAEPPPEPGQPSPERRL